MIATEMTYLSNHIQEEKWKRSLIFSLLSAIIIGLTYFVSPEEQDAGPVFAFNLAVFFPMLLTSTVLGIISMICLIRFTSNLADYEVKYLKQKVMATTVFLLPLIIHLILFVISLKDAIFLS